MTFDMSSKLPDQHALEERREFCFKREKGEKVSIFKGWEQLSVKLSFVAFIRVLQMSSHF